MKNVLKVILLFAILFPTIVLAKDVCNSDDIVIKSVSMKNSNGFSEEVNESSISNNKINLDLKMYDVGDSVTYNITIENSSNEKYYFTKDSFKMNTDYLEYSLLNSSEIIPANSKKVVELKVTYKNKIPNENYSDTNKVMISLSDNSLENPKTNTNYYIFILMLVILIFISIKYHKKGLFILSIFGLVSNVYAVCTLNINIEAKIEIVNKEAIFLPGREVNIKMKELAGDDTSAETFGGYYADDENIVSIKCHTSKPLESEMQEKNIVSKQDSPTPIYMWYDDGTIYWWSEDKHPNLNEDSSFIFYLLIKLNDISEFNRFDTSEVTNLFNLFGYDSSISDFSSLSDWNTLKVKSMIATFYGCSSMENVDFLEKWDVSNVNNMQQLFHYADGLRDLKGLKDWNVLNVKNMYLLFDSCTSLQSLKGLENWDVSNVTDFSCAFSGNINLSDSSAINDWNISPSATFTYMFRNVPSHPEFSKVTGTWKSNGTFTPTT